ncbi:MAG TPA: hypothetical protein PKC43_00375 [Phycisphaerales bacterium]|nr:hypothetical protein [Phycisphaerales bacterium]HMP35880.1 hypothetical protein [Phycisphaerales bacterium]
MPALIVIVSALTTGLLGLLGTGLLAGACVRWYSISSAEGKSGYFVVLLALLGGMLGLVVGLAASIAAQAATERLAGWTAWLAAVGATVALLAAATLFAWLGSLASERTDGALATLEVEARLPAGSAAPVAELGGDNLASLSADALGIRAVMYAGGADLAAARQEAGRWIVPLVVHVHLPRREVARLEAEGVEAMRRSVKGRALLWRTETFDWSEWTPEAAETGLAVRFRPLPQASEHLSSRPAQVARSPVDPAAPLAGRGAGTAAIADPETREGTLAALLATPGGRAEVALLARDADSAVAAAALRAIAHDPDPAAEWLPTLVDAAAEIERRLGRVVALSLEEDPSFLGAAEVGARFSAWMAAARSLRSRDAALAEAALAPQLARILDLARRRPESIVIQQDIRRVASHFLHEWTGAPPHPDDPPPR